MTPDDFARLNSVIDGLKAQYGTRILRQLKEITRPSVLRFPTTYPLLDEALGGGIPRGQLIELIGRPTTGMSTCVLRMLARAQDYGLEVTYLDCAHTFDASYAERHELKLDRLKLIQPDSGADALAMVVSLAHEGAAGMIILDALPDVLASQRGAKQLLSSLQRIRKALTRHKTMALFLNTPGCAHYLEHAATVRLSFQRQTWLRERGDIVGCRTRVTIERNAHHVAGRGATIKVAFTPALQSDTNW